MNCGSSASCSIKVLRELNVHQPVSEISTRDEQDLTILSPYGLQAQKQEAQETPGPLSFSVSLILLCCIHCVCCVYSRSPAARIHSITGFPIHGKSGYALKQVVMALCSDAPYWNKEIHLNLYNWGYAKTYMCCTQFNKICLVQKSPSVCIHT